MVDVSKFGTKEASGTAVLTRRDGSKVYIQDNKIVSERDSAGRSVARILIQPSTKTRGIIASKPVESTRELGISQNLQAVQEKVNIQTAGTTQDARVIGGVDQRGKLIDVRLKINGSQTKLIQAEREQARLLKARREAQRVKVSKPFLVTGGIDEILYVGVIKEIRKSSPMMATQLKESITNELETIRLLSAGAKIQFKKDMAEWVKNSKPLLERARLDLENTLKGLKKADTPREIIREVSQLIDVYFSGSNKLYAELSKRYLKDTSKIYSDVKKVSKGIIKNSQFNLKKNLDTLNQGIKALKKEISLRIGEFKEGKLLESEKIRIKQTGSKLKALKDVLPFVNKTSFEGYSNFVKRKPLTSKQRNSIVFDFVSLIPIAGWSSRAGVIATKTALSKTLVGKAISRNKKLVGTYKKLNPRKLTQVLGGMGSIVRNVGIASRVRNSAEDYYNVDAVLVNKVAKELGVSSKDLQNAYINEIAKNFADKKFRGEDIANFFGISLSSNRSIIKGQRGFLKFLNDRGIRGQRAKLLIGNLENKRRSLIIAQLVGLASIEISSEFLAQRLIKLGVGKKTGVAIAGMREGLAVLSQESYLQGYDLTPQDFLIAVVGGAVGSIYFSKQKVRDLRKKDVDSFIKKYSRRTVNKLKPKRLNEYAIKVVRKNLKVNQLEAKDLVFGMSKAEKRSLAREVIREGLMKSNRRKAKIPKKKALLLWRDPIANIIDPFELVGDVVYDISSKVRIKLTNKLRRRQALAKKKKAKGVRKKPKKIKKKAVTRVKTKTVSKAGVRKKPISRTKLRKRLLSRVITKVKTKIKPKTKVKTKTKTRVKPATKVKTKTKAKTKTKTKTKVKVKSIRFLLPKKRKALKVGEKIAYNIRLRQKGRVKNIIVKLPINRAKKELIRVLKSVGIKTGEIVPVSITKKKDITRVSTKGFKIRLGK